MQLLIHAVLSVKPWALISHHQYAHMYQWWLLSAVFQLQTKLNYSNSTFAGHDKLAHVRPVLEAIRENCLLGYNPHMDSSVDEAMVAFQGRLAFKQYLPMKPTKYGIKILVHADPHNGYANHFQMYTGKNAKQTEHGLAARVVKDLMGTIMWSIWINFSRLLNCLRTYWIMVFLPEARWGWTENSFQRILFMRNVSKNKDSLNGPKRVPSWLWPGKTNG